MTRAICDFCGQKTEVERTHYGTTFGYVRLICSECKRELGAKSIKEERIVSTKQVEQETL